MKSLIKQLLERSFPDNSCALVIGAGSGSYLDVLRNVSFSNIVLAEAHPLQAEALCRQIRPEAGEVVLPLAITPEPMEQATLQVMLNPVYNSLKTMEGLLTYFPNLRQVGQQTVNARSLVEVLKNLNLSDDGHHLLILDAPGQSYELLNSCPEEMLQLFKWILLRDGVESLYQNDQPIEQTLELIQSLGFEAIVQDEQQIFPYAAWLINRNEEAVIKYQQRKREKAEIEAREEQMKEKLSELQQTIQELQINKSAEQQKHQQERVDAAVREKNLSTELEELRNSNKKFLIEKNESDQQLIKISAELEAEQQEKQELQNKLSDSEQAFKDLGKEYTELKKSEQTKITAVKDWEQERSQLQHQIKQRTTELEEYEHRQQLLQEELIKAEAQVELIRDLVLKEPVL